MGRRSREREEAMEPAERSSLARGYARGEERNEQIRRSLEPLAPGERPGAVTVAAFISFALAIANLVALALGQTVGGENPRPAESVNALIFSAVLLVCAVFMWRAKYWAVLGFQALLALQVILCATALLVAGDIWTALVLLALVLLGGWLFWKLVRALARLQMPTR